MEQESIMSARLEQPASSSAKDEVMASISEVVLGRSSSPGPSVVLGAPSALVEVGSSSSLLLPVGPQVAMPSQKPPS